MKVLTESLPAQIQSKLNSIEFVSVSTDEIQETMSAPDYSEMYIEVQKIGNPVSFESLKEFYNIK